MRHLSRRFLGTVLCVVLLAGLVPPETASAAALVVDAGAARATVPAATGASAVAGASGVSAACAIPALAASLLPSATPLAAPAGGSAVLAPAAALSAPVAENASAPAPAEAAPTQPAPTAPTAPEAIAEAGARNDAPTVVAPAPAAPGASWLSRARDLLGRRAVSAAATESADGAKSAADGSFDGSAPRPQETPILAGPQGFWAARRAQAATWTLARAEVYKAARSVGHDDYGGPKPVPLSWRGRVLYGFQRGLNLIGAAAIVRLTVGPLFQALKWPLHLSADRLHSFGRVELLIHYGPAQIIERLASAPMRFLTMRVPLTTFGEELSYRILGFGLLFALLAAAKPASRLAASLLDSVPDTTSLRPMAQRVLRALGAAVSYFAFPAAALISSLAFATAHFELWGVSPVVFAVNLIAGYVLARAAYKTRGITAPFVAHLTFNLGVLGGLFLLISLHLPTLAALYGLAVSGVGMYSLWRLLRARLSSRAVVRARWLAGVALLAALTGALVSRAPSVPAADSLELLPAHDPAALVSGPAASASAASTPAAAPAPAAVAPALDPADMIARVKPTVVQIVVRAEGGYALGSGVIVAPDGRVVTNAHVVGDRRPGQTVHVELVDGRKLEARILAVNHDRDLAVVQLPTVEEGHPWPSSPFAADSLREGDPVYAMGHPRGLPFTVTHGIVSGVDARGNMYIQYLQTDAAINPGNSGGPLFNARGEIVGINTMIYTKSGGSEGLGFSIVTPSIVQALAQYDKTGNIDTAALGVIVDLSNPLQPSPGVLVEFVRPGSGADKSGLRRGDLILSVDGESITRGGEEGAEQLAATLAKARPGAKIKVMAMRGGDVATHEVSLDAKQTSEETSTAHSFANAAP